MLPVPPNRYVRDKLKITMDLDVIRGEMPGYSRERFLQPAHVVFMVQLILGLLVLLLGAFFVHRYQLYGTGFYRASPVLLLFLFVAIKEMGLGGEWGFAIWVRRRFFSSRLVQRPGIRFSLEPTRLRIDEQSFLYNDIDFVRLTAASAYRDYVILQLFDVTETEHQWRVERRARPAVEWLLDHINERVKNRKGTAPSILQSIRHSPKKSQMT